MQLQASTHRELFELEESTKEWLEVRLHQYARFDSVTHHAFRLAEEKDLDAQTSYMLLAYHALVARQRLQRELRDARG